MERQTLYQSSQKAYFSQFFRGSTIKVKIFRRFCLKSEDKPNSRYISNTFSAKNYAFAEKIVAFLLFSGDKGDYSTV